MERRQLPDDANAAFKTQLETAVIAVPHVSHVNPQPEQHASASVDNASVDQTSIEPYFRPQINTDAVNQDPIIRTPDCRNSCRYRVSDESAACFGSIPPGSTMQHYQNTSVTTLSKYNPYSVPILPNHIPPANYVPGFQLSNYFIPSGPQFGLTSGLQRYKQPTVFTLMPGIGHLTYFMQPGTRSGMTSDFEPSVYVSQSTPTNVLQHSMGTAVPVDSVTAGMAHALQLSSSKYTTARMGHELNNFDYSVASGMEQEFQQSAYSVPDRTSLSHSISKGIWRPSDSAPTETADFDLQYCTRYSDLSENTRELDDPSVHLVPELQQPTRNDLHVPNQSFAKDSHLKNPGQRCKRLRLYFDKDEENMLLEGVQKFGKAWSVIRKFYTFYPKRTPLDLRQKYYRLMKKRKAAAAAAAASSSTSTSTSSDL